MHINPEKDNVSTIEIRKLASRQIFKKYLEISSVKSLYILGHQFLKMFY